MEREGCWYGLDEIMKLKMIDYMLLELKDTCVREIILELELKFNVEHWPCHFGDLDDELLRFFEI